MKIAIFYPNPPCVSKTWTHYSCIFWNYCRKNTFYRYPFPSHHRVMHLGKGWWACVVGAMNSLRMCGGQIPRRPLMISVFWWPHSHTFPFNTGLKLVLRPKEKGQEKWYATPNIRLKRDFSFPLSLSLSSSHCSPEGSWLLYHKNRSIWKGTEALCQQLCDRTWKWIPQSHSSFHITVAPMSWLQPHKTPWALTSQQKLFWMPGLRNCVKQIFVIFKS